MGASMEAHLQDGGLHLSAGHTADTGIGRGVGKQGGPLGLPGGWGVRPPAALGSPSACLVP